MAAIDPSVIAAFATLLTPLTGMAVAIFTLQSRRIKKLQKSKADLMGYVLTTCAEKSEGMEEIAKIVMEAGRDE